LLLRLLLLLLAMQSLVPQHFFPVVLVPDMPALFRQDDQAPGVLGREREGRGGGGEKVRVSTGG